MDPYEIGKNVKAYGNKSVRIYSNQNLVAEWQEREREGKSDRKRERKRESRKSERNRNERKGKKG